LIKEIRKPILAAPGQQARYDYEYERNGGVNLFMMFEPLVGERFQKSQFSKQKARFLSMAQLWCFCHLNSGSSDLFRASIYITRG